MIYPQNFEQKIGFDQIRSIIKDKCLSALGIDYTDRMKFSTGYETIRKQLNQTWEFLHIIENAEVEPTNPAPTTAIFPLNMTVSSPVFFRGKAAVYILLPIFLLKYLTRRIILFISAKPHRIRSAVFE